MHLMWLFKGRVVSPPLWMLPCVKLLENILLFGWFELVKQNIAVSVKGIILGLPNRTDIINNLTSSNLWLGSAFCRIYVVWSWKTGLCEEKQIQNYCLCILSRPSGLESMYTKTRPKAANLQFSQKNLDFSRLRNEIRMRSLVPLERNITRKTVYLGRWKSWH